MESNVITRQIRVSAIADIVSRRSSYSAQFRLRKTAKNIKALDGVGIVGSSSRLPYSEVRVNYSVNTIPLVNNGYLTIEDDDASYFM
ncbi:hypothetical protein SAMN05192545_0016 [Maribacter dokdonensis]|uniref:Uncharacterized protein n=1 Tax=Maribacter dokdonensis TaxID=320912 RepID=A0ABY0TXV4_9FLAO|nr:hypothetical protein SAMN05192545_0016 [Maribacter dokdonensis]